MKKENLPATVETEYLLSLVEGTGSQMTHCNSPENKIGRLIIG